MAVNGDIHDKCLSRRKGGLLGILNALIVRCFCLHFFSCAMLRDKNLPLDPAKPGRLLQELASWLFLLEPLGSIPTSRGDQTSMCSIWGLVDPYPLHRILSLGWPASLETAPMVHSQASQPRWHSPLFHAHYQPPAIRRESR